MKPAHMFGTAAVALALLGASCSSGGSNSDRGGGSGGQTSQTVTTSGGGQAGASSSSKNGGNNGGGQAGASNSKDIGGGQAGATTSKGGAGQGGSPSSSTDASCGNGANVTPCGGDVVGTWNVTPSCLKVSGERNIEGISLGCLTVSVTGTFQVSGTWSANADGTYQDKTTTAGEEKLSLAAKCLEVSGTITTCDALNGTIGVLGYESVDCVSAAGGGCTCVAKINQKGGIALISSDPSTSGTYKTSDKSITVGQNALTQEVLQFSYCVSNGKMNWAPKLDGLTYTGAIAFQKGGAGGAGGSGGTTSSGGTGGSSGRGGTTAIGGTTASGGSAGKGGTTSSGGSTGASTSPGTGGPCDIYEAAKTPCVGAYSTVRALYKAYNGPLYQVRKSSDTTALKDIPLLEAGGYANSKVQDDFCTGGCTIAKLYDQSPKKNDLPVSGKTYWLVTTPPAPASHAVATESNATAAKITLAGHTVYGVRTNSGAGNSYRVNAKGTAVGDEPEAMYMVVDAKVYSALCCYDFGNVSTTGNPDGAATMETIYYGNATLFGHGAGKGPWLMADLEAGTYPSSNQNDPNIPSLSYQNYATLMLKGHAGDRFALKAGDAQTGALQTTWDGKRPKGYSPMKKQGAIVLGTGGDGSFLGTGVFFEGAITYGCPDDKAVDDAIQANIVAAGYGK